MPFICLRLGTRRTDSGEKINFDLFDPKNKEIFHGFQIFDDILRSKNILLALGKMKTDSNKDHLQMRNLLSMFDDQQNFNQKMKPILVESLLFFALSRQVPSEFVLDVFRKLNKEFRTDEPLNPILEIFVNVTFSWMIPDMQAFRDYNEEEY